ncbi:MAG: hypothetical protein LBT23_10005 [Synergistaceae bacterium]|jgi:hypothetical protein|nr:hypothetical protein [Synergistaceae bacterium]
MAEVKKTTAASSRSKQTQRMGEPASRKLIRIVLLIACCAGSVYFFLTTMQMLDDTKNNIVNVQSEGMTPDPEVEQEKQVIAAAEVGLANLNKASSQAMRIASIAESQGNYPIGPPTQVIPQVVSIAPGGEVIAEPDPPMVTVVAIMITDSDKVALLNIDGEEGVLVRQGSKFTGGTASTARITKIDAKGVTFTWMKKSYQVSL